MEQSIEELSLSIEEGAVARRRAENEISLLTDNSESSELLIMRRRLQLLSEIDEQLRQYEQAKLEIENLMIENEIQKSNAIIVAAIDGEVNFSRRIIEGEYVQSGEEIMTIIPKDDENLTVEFAVSNHDIGAIETGMEIDFSLLSRTNSEQNRVLGRVNHVSADARLNSNTGERYFLVQVSLDNESIENIGSLQIGMSVEGRITTENQRVLSWFLERINFLNRR